jgi:ATP-dependent helicase/nuclease subunit B
MLKLVDLDEDLIAKTVDEIAVSGGRDFSRMTVVFPNKRIQFFLREELSRRISGHYFPPPMFTIDAFFDSLYQLNFPGSLRIPEIEAAFHVYESVRQVFGESVYAGGESLGHFVRFFPHALQILQGLEEILIEGSRLEKIDEVKFKAFADLGDYHLAYKTFISRLPELASCFQDRLRRNRSATRGLQYHEIGKKAEDGTLAVPAAARWIFAGFHALNESEKKLFRFFFDRKRGLLLLKTDRLEISTASSPFSGQRETIRDLGLEYLPETAVPGEKPLWNRFSPKVTVHPTANTESEMVLIHDLLKKSIAGGRAPDLKRIGIVIADQASLIPFIQGVVSRFDQDEQPLPFNITLGYPLRRTPIFQLIDAMLRVRENGDGGTVRGADYLDLIRHPYVKLSGEESGEEPLKRGIHELEKLIASQNMVSFSIPEIEERIASVLETIEETPLRAAILSEVAALHQRFVIPETDSLTPLVRSIETALDRIRENGSRKRYLLLNEYIATAVNALQDLLDFAENGDGRTAFSGFSAMASLVRHYFASQKIPFEGSPLRGIQVMGLLEFRGLQFDEVIVADALEGVLPETKKYDPLLPPDVRRLFGIRDYTDWEKLFAFNFYSLIGGARTVHILYPQKKRGENTQPSRFIQRIIFEVEKEKGIWEQTRETAMAFSLRPRKLKEVAKNGAIVEKLKRTHLSPTAIETYIKCPLKFYFERIVGLREREGISSEADSGTFGTIVHDCLKEIFERYRDRIGRLRADSPDMAAALTEIVTDAYRRRHFRPEKGIERIRAWVLAEKLKDYIRFDSRRVAQSGIELKELEKPVAFLLDLNSDPVENPAGNRIAIRGKIDRIEKEEETIRVIDYKTGTAFGCLSRTANPVELESLYSQNRNEYGKNLNRFWASQRNFQILLYVQMLRETDRLDIENLDAAYAFLRHSDRHFFQKVFPDDPETKREIMDRFRQQLGEIVRDIFRRDTFLANDADERYCGYCPFRTLCGNP